MLCLFHGTADQLFRILLSGFYQERQEIVTTIPATATPLATEKSKYTGPIIDTDIHETFTTMAGSEAFFAIGTTRVRKWYNAGTVLKR